MFEALRIGSTLRGRTQPLEASLWNELVVICSIALLLVPSVAFSPSAVPGIILGLPAVFFLPGYALLSALYPGKGDLSGLERFLLSFALSLAVVPLIGLGLNFTSGVTLYPSLISLTAFILAMSVLAWWRRQALPSEERFALALPLAVRHTRPRVGWDYRPFLWLLLIALTASILVFPVNVTFDPSPIQSVHIFASLPLFAALFLAWMGVLLFLVFSRRESGTSDWEGLALACVSALGLISFWVIATPYGHIGDPLARLGDTKRLLETGRIPESKGAYLEFPGLFLFASFVSHLTSLDLFTISNLMRLFSTMLFAALLYLIYVNSFRSAHLAPLVVMLAILVGKAPRIEFLSDLISGPLLLAFLVLLTRGEQKVFDTVQERLLAVILLAAATITYFIDSLSLLFVALGIYLAQKWAREKSMESSILVLALVVVVSWEIYWATTMFDSMVQYLPALRDQFVGGETFHTARVAGEGAVGVAVPLWAIVTRYFWWVLFYGLGTVLGLLGLIRARQLTPAARREVGGLLGVILLTGVAAGIGERGFQFNRYFTYAPLFLAPILVRLCLGLGQGWKGRSLAVLPVVLFVLALPTFLLDGSSIATNSVYPQGIAAGEFLEANYGDGDGLKVYSNQTAGADISWYYTPEAIGHGPRGFHLLGGESGLWEDMNGLVDEFKSGGNSSIFVFSERITLGYYQIFGIQPTDPGWQHVKEELAEESLIFGNQYVQIYGSPSGPGR